MFLYKKYESYSNKFRVDYLRLSLVFKFGKFLLILIKFYVLRNLLGSFQTLSELRTSSTAAMVPLSGLDRLPPLVA